MQCTRPHQTQEQEYKSQEQSETRETEHMRNAIQAHLAFGADADALLAAANCKESSTRAPFEAQSSKAQSGEHLYIVDTVTPNVASVLQVPAVMYIARCLIHILQKTRSGKTSQVHSVF